MAGVRLALSRAGAPLDMEELLKGFEVDLTSLDESELGLLRDANTRHGFHRFTAVEGLRTPSVWVSGSKG